jgi:hypothetical protein
MEFPSSKKLSKKPVTPKSLLKRSFSFIIPKGDTEMHSKSREPYIDLRSPRKGNNSICSFHFKSQKDLCSSNSSDSDSDLGLDDGIIIHDLDSCFEKVEYGDNFILSLCQL